MKSYTATPVQLTETNQLKYAYNRMYSILSKYIREFNVVAALVDVELEAYKMFPDLDELLRKIDTLRTLVHRVGCDRPERAIDQFREFTQDVNTVYVKVVSPTEVLV